MQLEFYFIELIDTQSRASKHYQELQRLVNQIVNPIAVKEFMDWIKGLDRPPSSV